MKRIAEAGKRRRKSSENVLEDFPVAMKKLGIDVDKLEYLGSGDNGAAYDVGDGRVAKVTEDETEAEASAAVMGKNLPNIARIFGVYKLGSTEKFLILQEKLAKLSRVEESNLELHFDNTDIQSIAQGADSWEEVKRRAHANIDSFFPEEERKIAHGSADESFEYLEVKFSVDKMFEQLKSAGVSFFDYHTGNVMKRGNEYVLIDLGMSDVAEQQIDSLLERWCLHDAV